jgi:protein disulfide-isomerase A6
MCVLTKNVRFNRISRCGHCKALAPAWKQLGEAFTDNEDVIIGDVDCTKEESLCQKFGVQGYPTLKYFTGATSATGDAYQGGRDFEALQAFATENLGPSCGADNLDLCDAEQTKLIKEKQALSADEVTAEIEGFEAEIKKAGEDLDALLKDLQAQYEAGKTKKEETIAAISPKVALLRSVQRAAAAGTDKTEL